MNDNKGKLGMMMAMAEMLNADERELVCVDNPVPEKLWTLENPYANIQSVPKTTGRKIKRKSQSSNKQAKSRAAAKRGRKASHKNRKK